MPLIPHAHLLGTHPPVHICRDETPPDWPRFVPRRRIGIPAHVEVIALVMRQFGFDGLASIRQRGRASKARTVAGKILRETTTASYPEIAYALGYGSHSGAMDAIAALEPNDPEYLHCLALAHQRLPFQPLPTPVKDSHHGQ